VGSIVGTQFGKNALNPTFDGFLVDLELICNFFVRTPGCDESQDKDFGWSQVVISGMLSDFVRGFGRKEPFFNLFRATLNPTLPS